MTQDEIIRMAREACAPNQTFNSDEEWVKRFAALVAAHEREKHGSPSWETVDDAIAAEREACAKVCDEIARRYQRVGTMVADGCAAAIRAREIV